MASFRFCVLAIVIAAFSCTDAATYKHPIEINSIWEMVGQAKNDIKQYIEMLKKTVASVLEQIKETSQKIHMMMEKIMEAEKELLEIMQGPCADEAREELKVLAKETVLALDACSADASKQLQEIQDKTMVKVLVAQKELDTLNAALLKCKTLECIKEKMAAIDDVVKGVKAEIMTAVVEAANVIKANEEQIAQCDEAVFGNFRVEIMKIVSKYRDCVKQ